MSFPPDPVELNRFKSPNVIRATDGLVVRCRTSTLGKLTGASSNPVKGFQFSNQNEVVDLIFVEAENSILTHFGLILT